MKKYIRSQNEKPPEGYYWFSSPRYYPGVGYFHHSATDYCWFEFGDIATWEWGDEYDDEDGDSFVLFGPLTPPEDF